MAVTERFERVLNLLSCVNAVLCQRAQRLCEVSAASAKCVKWKLLYMMHACSQPLSGGLHSK